MVLNRKLRTEAQRQEGPPDPVQAAKDYGIDVQMLADNLRRTPLERVERHQIALDTVNMLRKAGRS